MTLALKHYASTDNPRSTQKIAQIINNNKFAIINTDFLSLKLTVKERSLFNRFCFKIKKSDKMNSKLTFVFLLVISVHVSRIA